MFRRRRKRSETSETSDAVEILKRRKTKRIDRVTKRTERRRKRREFFIGLTSNLKWIMLGLAVVVVICYLWFGNPISMITGLFT